MVKAIIIKGNPSYINNDIARKYYKDIELFLKENGVDKVEFDNGDDKTLPKLDADLYIAHSRGCSRYQYMPKDKQKVFLKFGVPDGVIDPVDLKWCKEVWEVDKNTPSQPPKEHFILIDSQKEAILDLLAKLKNVYQEENSTFKSKGKIYDLNYFWKQTHNQPILEIDVDLIKWVLEYDNDNSAEDKIRTNNVDLTAPLLVTKFYSKELVVDGFHRLKKAVSLNVKKLPYLRISKELFISGEINTSLENYKETIPLEILQQADNDPFLNDIIEVDKNKTRVPIYYGKVIAGFYTPRQTEYKKRMYWRTGAIYILPQYRKKGLASKAVSEFFSDKEYGLAFIEPHNAASLATFEKCGFKRTEIITGKRTGDKFWRMLKEPELKPAFLSW